MRTSLAEKNLHIVDNIFHKKLLQRGIFSRKTFAVNTSPEKTAERIRFQHLENRGLMDGTFNGLMDYLYHYLLPDSADSAGGRASAVWPCVGIRARKTDPLT